MCGSYSIQSELRKFGQYYQAEDDFGEFHPSSRTRPTETLPIITNKTPDKITPGVWGFKPSWKPSGVIINARKEGIATKPTFRESFQKRRCLVLVDSFIEWEKQKQGKSIPRYIAMSNGQPYALAGIWQPDPETKQQRFVIITVEPNSKIRPIHDRMPAILLPPMKDAWFDHQATETKLLNMLQAFPSQELQLR